LKNNIQGGVSYGITGEHANMIYSSARAWTGINFNFSDPEIKGVSSLSSGQLISTKNYLEDGKIGNLHGHTTGMNQSMVSGNFTINATGDSEVAAKWIREQEGILVVDTEFNKDEFTCL